MITKRIADMTPDEKREYRRQKNEERSQRFAAQRQMEEEHAARSRARFKRALDQAMKRSADFETPATARLLLASLSPEAIKVLSLWRLAEVDWPLARDYGDEIAERVRLVTGMKPKVFDGLVMSLASVGALLPNDYGEWIHEQTYREVGGDYGPDRGVYAESPVEGVIRAMISLSGHRLNQSLAELLAAQPEETP